MNTLTIIDISLQGLFFLAVFVHAFYFAGDENKGNREKALSVLSTVTSVADLLIGLSIYAVVAACILMILWRLV